MAKLATPAHLLNLRRESFRDSLLKNNWILSPVMSDGCSAKGSSGAPVEMACPVNGACSKQVDMLTIRSLVRQLPLGMPKTQYYCCEAPDYNATVGAALAQLEKPGYMTTPVTLIDKEVVVGFDVPKLRALLRRNRAGLTVKLGLMQIQTAAQTLLHDPHPEVSIYAGILTFLLWRSKRGPSRR